MMAVNHLSNALVRLPVALGGRRWGEEDLVGLTVLLQKQTLRGLCDCLNIVNNVKLYVVHQMLVDRKTSFSCEMLLNDIKQCTVLKNVMSSGFLSKDWGSMGWMMQFEAQSLQLDSLE